MLNLDSLPPEDIVRGYIFNAQQGAYICIHCGAVFEEGEVFEFGGRYFEASRAAALHGEREHPDALQAIMKFGGRYLQLTDGQKDFLALLYNGLGDGEIAVKLGVSASTVRHQRFVFREKAKAAKMLLAVWETAESGSGKQRGGDELLPVHGGAKMVDDRYVITEEENQKILRGVFESLEPLRLRIFSPKEKKKIVILRKIAEQFEKDRRYSEKEVNAVLRDIYDDYATIRRYLVEYGYMDRTDDGREYWLR